MPLLTLTRAPWRPRGPTPQRITELQNRLQRARQVLQAFKVEMRELPREYTGTYDAKAKQHHATLQKLHGDLQWAKTEGESAAGPSRNIDEMTSSEIIMEGAKIQDKSKAAVDRMKRQIEDSKQARHRPGRRRACARRQGPATDGDPVCPPPRHATPRPPTPPPRPRPTPPPPHPHTRPPARFHATPRLHARASAGRRWVRRRRRSSRARPSS
jgi:hypothetical protein